jgi:N-acyl-D-amino-acid deacylase
MYDILIKNGQVIDGSGTPGKNLDLAIKDGRVVQIAKNISSKAVQTIEANGRFVSPGFIDIQNHSDSYWTLFDQPEQASLLAQGITSIVIGNCGASLAPLLSKNSIKSIQKWHSLEGVNINWASVEEFLQMLTQIPLGVNVATLVGHATLRRGLVGDEIRQLTAEELKIMDKALKDALNQGALGLSMGLIYAHEVNASTAELELLCENLKSGNKYLSVHLRSEGSQLLESLDEVIGLAKKAGVPVKISHFKLRDEKNWHLFDQALAKLEQAYHQGVNISFDLYPYDTTWGVLYTYLPKWSYEGGRDKILSTIADPVSRRKILDYLRDQHHDYGAIIIATSPGNNNFVGKTIRQIAANQNISNEEAILNVITATKAQVIVFDRNLSVKQVESLLASPLSMIATDGAGYNNEISGLTHPRCYGTMPRFLQMVRESKILKWEEAVKKITSDPAKFLGITDRGNLKVGSYADVVIWDPLTIADRADYISPDVFPVGMEWVIVNGRIAFSSNQVLNAAGMVMKR